MSESHIGTIAFDSTDLRLITTRIFYRISCKSCYITNTNELLSQGDSSTTRSYYFLDCSTFWDVDHMFPSLLVLREYSNHMVWIRLVIVGLLLWDLILRDSWDQVDISRSYWRGCRILEQGSLIEFGFRELLFHFQSWFRRASWWLISFLYFGSILNSCIDLEELGIYRSNSHKASFQSKICCTPKT